VSGPTGGSPLPQEDPQAIEALWDYSQGVVKQAVEHFERIDEKTQQYFSFGGVIVALLLSSSKTVLSCLGAGGWFLIPTFFFFVAIIAMSVGIFFAIKAYFLRSVDAWPLPEKIANWYASSDCKDKSRMRILELFIVKASRSAETYNRMASEKAIPLKRASRCFMVGLTALVIFAFSFGTAHLRVAVIRRFAEGASQKPKQQEVISDVDSAKQGAKGQNPATVTASGPVGRASSTRTH